MSLLPAKPVRKADQKHRVLVDGAEKEMTREEATSYGVRLILQKGLSYRTVENMTHVSRSALQERVAEYRAANSEPSTRGDKNSEIDTSPPPTTRGRPRLLPDQLEAFFADRIEESIDTNSPFRTGAVFRKFVQQTLNKCALIVKGWKDNLPGPRWCRRFLARNGFKMGTSTNQGIHRAMLPLACRDRFFKDYAEVLNLVGGLPDHIFNVDEKVFALDRNSTDTVRCSLLPQFHTKCPISHSRALQLVRLWIKHSTCIFIPGYRDGRKRTKALLPVHSRSKPRCHRVR